MKFQKGQTVVVDGEEYVVQSGHIDEEWPHDPVYVLEDEDGFIHEYESNIEEKQNGIHN